uniref:CSON003241 protein n=1 Tax=Culicoides sonorensis TaxID=179676 RepID=A0A336LWH3_CULSO
MVISCLNFALNFKIFHDIFSKREKEKPNLKNARIRNSYLPQLNSKKDIYKKNPMEVEYSSIAGCYFTTSNIQKEAINRKLIKTAQKIHSSNFTSILDAIQVYKNSIDTEFYGVFAIPKNQVGEKKAYKLEKWFAICILKKNNQTFDTQDKHEKTDKETENNSAGTFDRNILIKFTEKLLQDHFCKEFFDFDIIQSDDMQSMSHAWSVALQSIQKPEITLQVFNRTVVENAFADEKSIRSKEKLETVLDSFDILLAVMPNYTFGKTQFEVLCKKINSENFRPSSGDTVDLRVRILKTIVNLNENGQKIDDKIKTEVFDKENGFLKKEKDLYINTITDLDQELKVKWSNKYVSLGCLKLAINDRIKYLKYKNKLLPNSVTVDQVFQLLHHYELVENVTKLQNKKKAIEKKIQVYKKTEQVKKSKKSKYKHRNLIDKIEYCNFKLRIRDECHFEHLIDILVCKRLEIETREIFKLFEIAKQNISETMINKILQILLSIPTYNNLTFKKFPSEFINYITGESQNLLIDLIEKGYFGNNYCNGLATFLVSVLTENEDKKLRSRALDLLKASKNSLNNPFKAIIHTETLIHNESKWNIFTTENPKKSILDNVKSGYSLTIDCFEFLAKSNFDENFLMIIETIINRDLQTLPNFFVDAIKKKQ